MMSVDPTESETRALAAELRMLVGQLRRRLRREALLGDFSEPQIRVLALIGNGGPATVSTLARAEGLRPQSMGQTVASLREAGMLEGVPDPADGRQTLLQPTALFRERLQASRAAREDWLVDTLRSHFDEAEQQQLAAAIALLKRLADA